jgi:MFS family permease
VNRRHSGRSGIATLRLTFVMFAGSSLLLGFVLTLIDEPESQEPAARFATFVAIAGVAGVALCVRSGSRPLDASDQATLVASYAAQYFVGMAFAQLPVIAGFVGATVTGHGWMYGLGLAFAVVGFAFVAPTNGRIRRRDEQLVAAGSAFRLSEALQAPPAKPV